MVRYRNLCYHPQNMQQQNCKKRIDVSGLYNKLFPIENQHILTRSRKNNKIRLHTKSSNTKYGIQRC